MGVKELGIFRILPGDPRHGGIEPTEEKVAAIAAALDSCDYDWDRILPGLPRRRFGTVPVVFENRGGIGSYWPNVAITLSPGLSYESISRVFIYEVAHLVDVITLDNADRMALHTLFHGGGEVKDSWGEGSHNEQAKEAFMYAFHNAFVTQSDKYKSYGKHDVTDWETVRSIVLRRDPGWDPRWPYLTNWERWKLSHSDLSFIEWMAEQRNK